MKRKMNIAGQIESAREILSKKGLNTENDIIMKLKETTDKAELVYNDMKVKDLKSKAVHRMLKQIEHDLDELLRKIEANNLISRKL